MRTTRTTDPKTVLAMAAAFVMGAVVTFATIETVTPQAMALHAPQVAVDRR